MATQTSKRGGTKTLADRSVHVIGQNQFQNELLSFYLKEEMGIQCTLSERPSGLLKKHIKEADRSALILIECPERDIETFLSELEINIKGISDRHKVAIFNVDREQGLEERAVALGIKGIFYREDPIGRFRKGIGAIFEGELWVSREVLTKYIMENRAKTVYPHQNEPVLTAREIEILAMISMGIKNEEIANKLCISPNTVKTHIYNIFKKIGVPNRLQAALWAAKNL
jgi:DNA-binding NarL/FixJ family response regulator